MQCPVCQNEARRFGRDRRGNQRFQCCECKKTFADTPANPLGEMRLSVADAVRALQLILEGMSLRATTRVTGISRTTLLELLVLIGGRCSRFLATRIHKMDVSDVQCDEIWGFVAMKEKTRKRLHPDNAEVGDVYTFTALDRQSKLVLAWHVGTRSGENTELFIEKLADATTGRFQISTDGFKPYTELIPKMLPFADFAQLIKEYATLDHGKYSPGEVIGTRKKPVNGNPEKHRICTSHVERSNLTIRMSNRRMTRLTNGFSKKWENHEAAMAIQMAFYNFCRKHMTLKTTPAVKAGLEDHVWTLEELILKTSTH